MKNITKISTLLTIALLSAPVFVHAGGPGFGGGVDDGGGACTVPLDGGFSILIAAGIGYGAKKLRKKTGTEQEAKK